jgi:hypothetical protein
MGAVPWSTGNQAARPARRRSGLARRPRPGYRQPSPTARRGPCCAEFPLPLWPRPGVAQGEHEAPHAAALPRAFFQIAQVPPVELCLLARGRLETAYRHFRGRPAPGMQIGLENAVAAGVAPLPELPQQHHRIPHPRPEPAFQVLDEGIESRLRRIRLRRTCWAGGARGP